MKNYKNFFLLSFFWTTYIFCSCILGGGGTEDPSTSHQISGFIQSKGTTNLTGVKVHLSKVSWNSKINRVEFMDSTITDERGHFQFQVKEKGAFSLIAEDQKGFAALSDAFIAKPDSTTQIILKLKKRTQIKGRVLVSDSNIYKGLRIFIVGYDNIAQPDSVGVYALPNVPQGKFSLMYSSNSIIKYLPIDFNENADEEVYVNDVEFNPSTKPDTLHDDIPAPVGNELIEITDEINPIEYLPGQEPLWYKDKNFNEVIYTDTTITK